MNFPEKLTIKWIRAKYDSNELTPYTLAEEIVKRAKAHADKNIWIIPPSMEFMKPYIDALPAKRGPLWGIPFGIKDNIDLAGVPTTVACPAYAYTPPEDATVMKKLLEAGAIPAGKANLDQFASGLGGVRSPYGEVHNALQPELISGGSSSGSGVCVATGQVAFALGTDTGGSSRMPASLNGLVAYKPPLGSWSGKGVIPCMLSIDCVSVISNNLEDALIVDEIVRGYDPDFLYTRKIEKKEPKAPKKLLLPKDRPNFHGPWADIYESKWQKALSRVKAIAKNLEKNLELEVDTLDISIFDYATKIYAHGCMAAQRWGYLGEFIKNNPGKLMPATEATIRAQDSPEKTAVALFKDIHNLKELTNKLDILMEDAVLVLPTSGGTYTREEIKIDPITKNNLMGEYVYFCNPSDLCAIALPENTADKEYPFGITMFALPFSEDILCYMAERFFE